MKKLASLDLKASKPTPMHANQYTDFFLTYKEGFNMLAGESYRSQVPEDEQVTQLSSQLISGKLTRDEDDKCFLPPSNNTNNFDTVDYEDCVETNCNYVSNHAFQTLTVSEKSTLHTTFEMKLIQFFFNPRNVIEKASTQCVLTHSKQ